MLLFGRNPNRYLPHAGVSAAAYAGVEKDYDAKERATVRGPAVSLAFQRTEADGTRFPRQPRTFSESIEWIDSGVIERTLEFVRRNIGLKAWIDAGGLPNTVTVAKMRAGYRATRNELVKEVLRDYRYVEATGLGVPRKIIRGMREHNGTEPDLVEEDDRFTVRLWKQSPSRAR